MDFSWHFKWCKCHGHIIREHKSISLRYSGMPLFKCITLFCGTDNIPQNIQSFRDECEEYFAEYCESHMKFLWIWIMFMGGCCSVYFFLIGYLYVIGVWVDKDERTHTPLSPMFRRDWTMSSIFPNYSTIIVNTTGRTLVITRKSHQACISNNRNWIRVGLNFNSSFFDASL